MMKMKKLFAGLVASAVAVTCMATSAFADTPNTDYIFTKGNWSITSVSLSPGESHTLDLFNGDQSTPNLMSLEGYSSLEITYTCGFPDQVQYLQPFCRSTTNSLNSTDVYSDSISEKSNEGTLILDLTEVNTATDIIQIGLKVYPASGYFTQFRPNFEITSAKLVATQDDGNDDDGNGGGNDDGGDDDNNDDDGDGTGGGTITDPTPGYHYIDTPSATDSSSESATDSSSESATDSSSESATDSTSSDETPSTGTEAPNADANPVTGSNAFAVLGLIALAGVGALATSKRK